MDLLPGLAVGTRPEPATFDAVSAMQGTGILMGQAQVLLLSSRHPDQQAAAGPGPIHPVGARMRAGFKPGRLSRTGLVLGA
jgi:hypothetical protein